MSTITIDFVMKFMKLAYFVSAMIIDCRREELKAWTMSAGRVTDMTEGGRDEEIRVDAFMEESIQEVRARSILQ
jgi:hypothetical protein